MLENSKLSSMRDAQEFFNQEMAEGDTTVDKYGYITVCYRGWEITCFGDGCFSISPAGGNDAVALYWADTTLMYGLPDEMTAFEYCVEQYKNAMEGGENKE